MYNYNLVLLDAESRPPFFTPRRGARNPNKANIDHSTIKNPL
jgi:hypothetical protein